MSVTSDLLAPLLFVTGLTHFTGGTRNGLHELRGNVDSEHMITALVEWAEQSGLHIRSDGKWLFQAIPGGNTVGSLHLAQLEISSVFDRWKTSPVGVIEQGPSFDIQVVASEELTVSSIRIDTRLGSLILVQQHMPHPVSLWGLVMRIQKVPVIIPVSRFNRIGTVERTGVATITPNSLTTRTKVQAIRPARSQRWIC